MPDNNTIKHDFKYIRNILLPFLKENGDRRISSETLAHYRLFATQRPTMDELIITEVSEDNKVKAISIATITNGSHVRHSTTVTYKECRNQGHGTQALRAKIAALKERGMGIKTVIAEDNAPAMKICEKVGLRNVETRQRNRSTGPFNAVIWVDPPTVPADTDEAQAQ